MQSGNTVGAVFAPAPRHIPDAVWLGPLQMFQLSLTGQYSRRALKYVNASMLYLMNFAYVSFALCNALGCIWYFTAVTEGIEKSWLSSIGEPLLCSEYVCG